MAAINGNGAGSPSLSDESCITILDASRHFYTLSDDELTRIREWIPEKMQELLDIETAIQQLSLRKLEIEHTLPAAYSLLAPIRVLPAELLLEVFGWVIFSDTVLDTTKLPTIATLLATCSAWHSMICMVPDFWTTWEIRIPTSRFEEHFQRSPFAEFLEIALGRSQRSPLIINIFALVPIPHRTMEVVLTHGHHIKHLGIYTPHHIGSYAPVNDEAQVPALTTLETLDLPSKWFSLGHATAELNYEASFVDMERAPSISLFEHLLTARSLKNLRADWRMLLVFAKTPLSFSWNQIKCLHLEMVALTPLFQSILRALAPSVQTLDLAFDRAPITAPEPTPDAAIILVALEKMRLGFNPHTEIIMKWIRTPNLQHLHIWKNGADQTNAALPAGVFQIAHVPSTWRTDKLSTFLDLSAPQLSTLRISHLAVDADTLVHIFTTTGSQLKVLDLNETGSLTSELLEVLITPTSESQHEGMLPMLEDLGIRGGPERKTSVLSDIVKARTLLFDASGSRQLLGPGVLKRVTIRDDDVDIFTLRNLSFVAGFSLAIVPQLSAVINESENERRVRMGREDWLKQWISGAMDPVRIACLRERF